MYLIYFLNVYCKKIRRSKIYCIHFVKLNIYVDVNELLIFFFYTIFHISTKRIYKKEIFRLNDTSLVRQ